MASEAELVNEAAARFESPAVAEAFKTYFALWAEFVTPGQRLDHFAVSRGDFEKLLRAAQFGARPEPHRDIDLAMMFLGVGITLGHQRRPDG